MTTINPNADVDELTEYGVLIVNHEGQATSITDLVHSLEIYQSMLNSAMTCKLVVNDRVNMIHDLPLRGEEQIVIILNSVASKAKRTLVFAVSSIEEIDFGKNLADQNYSIFGISPEAIRNELYLISQSYRVEVGEIVKKVYTDHIKTNKKVTVETTGGQNNEPIILPKMKPFDALAFLRQNAMSAESSCHAFFSYETMDGFFFVTPDSRFKIDPVATLTLNHSITKRFAPFDVISINNTKKVDFLDELNSGLFYSETIKYDLVGKTPIVVKFDGSKDASWKSLEKGKRHTEKFVKDYSGQGARRFMLVWDSNRRDQNTADYIGSKFAYLANLGAIQTEINVPGNLDITPGSVIILNIPETVEVNQTGKSTPQLSGRFLVCDVIHHVLNQQKMYTRLLLFKDSFSG